VTRTLAETIAENRRLCILRTLETAPSFTANDSLLHTIVGEFGLPCSRDQVRSDIVWLRDQGLVTVDEVSAVYIVRATQRGCDVALGNTTVPGVKRRGP
jgi:hypothetical protein